MQDCGKRGKASMTETLNNILDAISETVYKIGRYESPEKIQSLSMSAALLAVTYKTLESSMYADEEYEEELGDD